MNKQQISALLYYVGMESNTAQHNMPLLCQLMGVKYPPNPFEVITVESHFVKGTQPPVSAAFN